MSAISAPSHLVKTGMPDIGNPSLHDVRNCVKSWGRRGIFLGANFGFVLGAIFVAIPYSNDVLAFGAIGTLVVGVVECVFIAGAFAALAAALYGKGVHRSSAAQLEHTLQADRRSAVSPAVPLADWPRRWAYPVQASRLQQIPDNGLNTAFSLPDAQARLSTIDAWENGNTGP